jgi:hypothetical protein
MTRNVWDTVLEDHGCCGIRHQQRDVTPDFDLDRRIEIGKNIPPSSPLKNRRRSEGEGFCARSRRRTGSNAVGFVGDSGTKSWRKRPARSRCPVFQRAARGPAVNPRCIRRPGTPLGGVALARRSAAATSRSRRLARGRARPSRCNTGVFGRTSMAIRWRPPRPRAALRCSGGLPHC